MKEESAVDKLTTAIIEAGIDVSLLQAAPSEVRNQSWQAATAHARAIRSLKVEFSTGDPQRRTA